ncbi:ATP-grasp domain-containing protein [Nonomuraea sp. NPDC046570]|uniref:ATP-grasp domain-containing protein n=1 Tax=Nonomuraea sp. NPDC046570 TaxID=3155255 RepID=UPI00340D6746
MRELILLGGADGALTTVRAARRLGVRTICVDVRRDAPAAAEADEFLPLSTRDVDAVAAALHGRRNVAAVLSPASDVNLPAQLALARRLGLPYGLSETAVRASVDKAFFRHLCDDLGLPGPRHVSGPPGAVLAGARALRFPIIVKPTGQNGSRGVTPCAEPAELPAAVAVAAAYGPVIAEEYVPGAHVSIEAVVQEGRVALLGIGRRTMTPPPRFITLAQEMAPGSGEPVRAVLDKICAELGYRWGSLTADAVVTEGGEVVLIEMGARLGGNGLGELLGLTHGLDALEICVRAALDDPVDLVPRARRWGACHILAAPRSGRLVAVHGLDRLPAAEVVLAVRPGDLVGPYDQAGAKLGYILLTADDEAGLAHARTAVDALRVEVS